jgi:hypothetical protein
MHPHRASRLLVVLLPLLVACSGVAKTGPQETLRRYVHAIESDHPTDAYVLLDESIRKQMTPTEFIARWKSLRVELQAQAVQLKPLLGKPVKARAQVSFPSGARASLSYADDLWKIDDGIALSGGAATPADALRAFIRAVESRNYELVMRFLARSVRDSIERDITERVAKLKHALNHEIEVTGGRARLQYDPRYKIELIQEEGEWRILDLD